MGDSLTPKPVLLGHYQLVELIATGGMAEVYDARRVGPHGFHKSVAVKRILPQLAKDDEFVAMFIDEAKVASTLSHPNIVQLFDFGEQDGELYMVMELVRGTNAARLIRTAAANGIEVPLEVALHVAVSVLRGLEYAHGARDEAGNLLRLVHRDVSPGNVLIDDSGAVKLTDFGIARAATFERRTAVGHLKGKLGYMSPEQVIGIELDARSDLFTLAIVLAELVILRPLFVGGSELEVLTHIRDVDLSVLREASVPDDVREVLGSALARSPTDRYPTARAFADELEALARHRRLTLSPDRLAQFLKVIAQGPQAEKGAEVSISEVTTGGLKAVEAVEEIPSQRMTAPVASYTLRKPDGRVVGPMQYHEVAELFATGLVGDGSLVSRDGGSFAPPASYPELQRFVTSSALRWENEGSWSSRSRRLLDRAALPSWLFRLAVRKRTGAILLRDGKRQKKIFLASGVPEFASSTDKRELLGEHLIAKGKVLRVEVEMALSILPRFGGRLGDALVGLGALRPVELFRAIHEQTVERYLELFRWTGGEITFENGARSEEEAFPLGVDPFELISRGVRENYTVDEMSEWLNVIGDTLVAPAPSPPLRRDALSWSPGEARVLEALDHGVSLSRFLTQQLETGNVHLDEALRAIFLGLSFGVLVSKGFEASEM